MQGFGQYLATFVRVIYNHFTSRDSEEDYTVSPALWADWPVWAGRTRQAGLPRRKVWRWGQAWGYPDGSHTVCIRRVVMNVDVKGWLSPNPSVKLQISLPGKCLNCPLMTPGQFDILRRSRSALVPSSPSQVNIVLLDRERIYIYIYALPVK